MAADNPVNWFEIPVNDIARATRFYEGVFGVKLDPMNMGPAQMAMFPMNPEGTNAGGALVKTEGYVPSHAGTVVYFAVADIEGTLTKIGANGGSTLVPKMRKRGRGNGGRGGGDRGGGGDGENGINTETRRNEEPRN
jgi:predicted enzyme related to lactoylglutathione lyase